MSEVIVPSWFRDKLVKIMGEAEAEEWLRIRGATAVADWDEAASAEAVKPDSL